MTSQYTHAESMRRLGDFALAQVFRPQTAAQQAAQVLLPAQEVFQQVTRHPCRGGSASRHWSRG